MFLTFKIKGCIMLLNGYFISLYEKNQNSYESYDETLSTLTCHFCFRKRSKTEPVAKVNAATR